MKKHTWKLLICITFLINNLQGIEEHEKWWEECLNKKVSMHTFRQWLGDIDAPSRVAMRKHVKQKGYSSILDVPSGVCTDYFGFKNSKSPIKYQGVDVTPMLVKSAKKLYASEDYDKSLKMLKKYAFDINSVEEDEDSDV